jgi:hypothetical protein
LLLVLPLLALGASTPESAKLRQTGEADGDLDRISRDVLCERAEDRAYKRVWAACPERRELTEVQQSGCTTTDYRPAELEGRGAHLSVMVQVSYLCR